MKAIRFAAPIPTYLATLAAGRISRRFYTGALACTRYGDVERTGAAERAVGAHPDAARRHLRQRPQRHHARREPVDVAVLVVPVRARPRERRRGGRDRQRRDER